MNRDRAFWFPGRRCLTCCLLLVIACAEQTPPDPAGDTAWRPGSDSAQQSEISNRDDGGAAAVQASARFLAGMEAEDAGQIPADFLPHWQLHADAMNSAWQRLNAEYLQPIDRFTGQHLSDLPAPEAPLFYPFGGPDLLHAMHFFPAATTYVLVGLEEPGELPRLAQMDPTELEDELGRIREVLDNVFEAGYFVRKRMRQDLPGRWSGIVSVFYIQLARAGAVPTAATYITVTPEGEELPLSDPQAQPSAVRIDFTIGDEPRRLYFFSQDLADEGLAENPGFGRFVEGLGSYNALLKSAQYLPHLESFSTVRSMVTSAKTVLQDDSGLPYASFAAEDWQVRLFGQYSGTLAAFHEYRQEDLATAFSERQNEVPLGFRVGYNGELAGGCLILAERHEMP